MPTAAPLATTLPHPVHLVGAGPGDPELLTLKAVRVLREATVILVDDLVGETVLREVLGDGLVGDAVRVDTAANDAIVGSAATGAASRTGTWPGPRIVHVGKRGGCASTPQAFIEKLMVREALAGEKVVRLKGGDPLVFGRAGEEIRALREAGLAVEVVNGITSGLAAVNSLGTGWTDRRHAQGVLLVTGHGQPGSSGPDWDAIARVAASGVTLVIYMGITQVERISAALRAHLPDELPAAVVQHASTPRERTALMTLGTLVQTLQAERFGSPAILVVGRVLDEADVQQLKLPLADPGQPRATASRSSAASPG